jgi:hypothetical protein
MTPLSAVERRSHNLAVAGDASVGNVKASHPFVPVVDATGRLIGIVERRRLGGPLPHAA